MSIGWDKDPAAFADTILKDFENKYKKVAKDIYFGIVTFTPVLTGSLKNNTHVSFNQQDIRHMFRDADKQEEVVKFFGGSQIAKIDSIPSGQFPVIYIQNNLPYADYVENGTSKMAPRSMFKLGFQYGISVNK